MDIVASNDSCNLLLDNIDLFLTEDKTVLHDSINFYYNSKAKYATENKNVLYVVNLQVPSLWKPMTMVFILGL